MQTPLSDALAASQRAALAALCRSYVRRADDPDDGLYMAMLVGVGLEDELEAQWLLRCWRIMRDHHEAPPQNGAHSVAADNLATDAQWALLRRLAGEKQAEPPEGPLTKDQASQVIDQLKKGIYKAQEWAVPF